MILVTGASGKTGRAVVQKLAANGQHVRAVVHRQEQVALLENLGATEVIAGDMVEWETLQRAAAGTRAIYHICPNMHQAEVSIGDKIIRVANEAGIERIVYHSVLHPQIESMAHHWQKMRVEEMLFESGLPFTILQPAAYMQNLLGAWERIVRQGIYAVPYALDTRLSMVDLQDVAEVAVKALTEQGHLGATYELCGAELLSQSDIAVLLEEQLGREVRGEFIAIEKWEQQARSSGLSDYALDTLMAMFRYYERYNFWGNSHVLGWLLGRSPTTFVSFLKRTI